MKFEEITDGLIGAVFVMNGEKYIRLQGEPSYLADADRSSYMDAATHFGIPEDAESSRAVHRHNIAEFEDGTKMWQFYLGRTDEPDTNL